MRGSALTVPAVADRVGDRWRWGLKALLAAAFVLWFCRDGRGPGVLTALRQVQPGWLALAVGTYLGGQSLCAWKWSLLARALGFRRPFAFYWVNYLGAMFPSLLLPTTVGADLFRVAALGRSGAIREATVSVLADRGTGVLALVWIAAVFSPYEPALHRFAVIREAIYAVTAVLTLGFLLPFRVRPGFARKGIVGRSLSLWNDRKTLAAAVALSLGFQLLLCVVHLFLGLSLGLRLPVPFYFVLCPIVSVAAMSPMTINGLGERIAALVLLFSLAHVGQEQGVAFGVVWSAMVSIAALAGGLLLALADRQAGWMPPAGVDRERPEAVKELG